LDFFKPGVSDEIWMSWVGGALDSPILGKDKAHRYMPKEKVLIIKHKLRIFTFSSGNLNGRMMAEQLKAALSQIERMAKEQPPPFVASITRTGVHLRTGFLKLR
jgi:hypothetical protein